MVDILYQSLIFAGFVIFAVIFYMKRAASGFLKVITEIIKVNELNEYDPVKFLETLPPLIDKLGIHSYSYYLYYHDTEHQKHANHKKNSFKKFVCAQDFTIFIEISPGKLRWERAYLVRLLVETVFLILKIDVNLNLRAANKALSEFNKINAFLSHDVKNLVQFLNIMQHNLSGNLTSNDKERLIRYMKSSAPTIKMRADRVLSTITENTKDFMTEDEVVTPCLIARNIASIMNVPIQCNGEEEEISTDRKSLIIIFENLIKNFYDKSINEPGIKLTVSISKSEEYFTISFSDTGSMIPNTERIFEPFFSDKKGGLGIGLYHCRSIASNISGKLWAENSAEGPTFVLQLKRK